MSTAAGVAGDRFLLLNGVPLAGDVPPVSAFLESTSGAYTTTRTHAGATLVLFWDRHLRRLAESARLLAASRPDLFGSGRAPSSDSIRTSVHDSLRSVLSLAIRERGLAGSRDELAVTALVRGHRVPEKTNADASGSCGFDVFLHVGFYLPPVFGLGGARLAVAGPGRECAAAKWSEWARVRKGMERMRPPMVTELLLTNDGDRILEGTVTNFFVVCRRKVAKCVADDSPLYSESACAYEVQTAPVSDGVLPGIIRQLVIEVCSSRGVPVREVAPSWSNHELWEEAFVTSSLRLVQHVETIQAPKSHKELQLKTWSEVAWEVKQFEGAGLITAQIQGAIMKRMGIDGYQISSLSSATKRCIMDPGS